MSIYLDRGKIRSKKLRHDLSHCDRCSRHLSPQDTLSQPAPGKVRCMPCTRLSEDEEAPTGRLVRLPVAPPPCGRRMDSTYPPAGPVHTNLQDSATAMPAAARESDSKALAPRRDAWLLRPSGGALGHGVGLIAGQDGV